MGLFDWLKRAPGPPPTWHVRRDGDVIVAEDDRGHAHRLPLAGAQAVRIVPLTGGQPHGGTSGGYQVALVHAAGDQAVGAPTPDWQVARELARQVCESADLPLDELTERMFSRVGSFTPRTDA